MIEGQSILIARKTAKSMRKSVWLELNKAIERLDVGHLIKIHKTDMTFESLVSKGSITLVGLDDSERLKSITPIRDNAFNVCMIEEATEVSEFDYQQLLIRQRGLSDFPKKMILLFNPIYRQHWIYRLFFEDKVPTDIQEFEYDNVSILKTTYKNNKFLGEEEKQTLENLKFTSPYHYQVYCLGNFGVLGELVFENWAVEDFDYEDIQGEIRVGMDFGYAADPTTIIFLKLNKKLRSIYVYHEEYGHEWTNDRIAEVLKPALFYNAQPNTVVYADSAEPKSIKDLSNKGFSIIPAKKGKDSIRKGIDFIKQYKLIIHPDCDHLIDELNQYTWKTRDGERTNEPIDKFNHCIDGCRYALSHDSAAGGKIQFTKMKL